jgi:hypothetical protein
MLELSAPVSKHRVVLFTILGKAVARPLRGPQAMTQAMDDEVDDYGRIEEDIWDVS